MPLVLRARFRSEARGATDSRYRTSLRRPDLHYQKRLEDFDYAAQPAVDRRLIDELATCRFLHEGRSIVFLGPPGVGKTHLAIALGLLTAEAGHRVYFTTAIEMTRRLAKALAENKLHRELHNMTRSPDWIKVVKIESSNVTFEVTYELCIHTPRLAPDVYVMSKQAS